MPRRYYRSRIRYIAPKKKWASNIVNGTVELSVVGSHSTSSLTGVFGQYTLAENKSQAFAPTPTIIKTANFKVQGVLTFSIDAPIQNINYVTDLNCYIFYLPEGIATVTGDVINAHPEWIMGWSKINIINPPGESNNYATKFSVTSKKLKRNLNSGDKVVLAFIGQTEYTGSDVLTKTFPITCQFTSCAN